MIAGMQVANRYLWRLVAAVVVALMAYATADGRTLNEVVLFALGAAMAGILCWREPPKLERIAAKQTAGSSRSSCAPRTATTQPANPLNYYHVVGVFDMLGQSRRLLQPARFPLRTSDEESRVVHNLTEAVASVGEFRNLFRQQFDARRAAFEQSAAAVPEGERAAFVAALASHIMTWGMSDTYCIAVPLHKASGAAGAMASMADVRRSFEAAAAAWLISLARGAPIRGGVEIGYAASMEENEVYGEALVQAHHLESKIAGGPRIVVGENLVTLLHGASQNSDVDWQGAAEFARNCQSMLRQDPDGKTTIDALGGSWATPDRRLQLRDVFADAWNNVRRQLLAHEAARCETLVSRYTELLTYFDEHARAWRE